MGPIKDRMVFTGPELFSPGKHQSEHTGLQSNLPPPALHLTHQAGPGQAGLSVVK